jgi:hypothetical protein
LIYISYTLEEQTPELDEFTKIMSYHLVGKHESSLKIQNTIKFLHKSLWVKNEEPILFLTFKILAIIVCSG